MAILDKREREQARSQQDPVHQQEAAQPKGAAMQELMCVLGQPEPERICSMIESHPGEQAAIIGFCHQRFGNGFVNQVFQQRRAEPGLAKTEVTAPADGAVELGAPTDVDCAAAAEELIGQGQSNENVITNEVFWRRYPAIRDVKLSAGTKESREWIRVRNEHVRPALGRKQDGGGASERPAPPPMRAPKAAVPEEQHAEPAPETKGPTREEAAKIEIPVPNVEAPAPKPNPGFEGGHMIGNGFKGAGEGVNLAPMNQQVNQAASAVPETTGAATAGATDAYYGQGDNSYRDKSQTGAGLVFDRGWASHKPGRKGTAGGNTCNMTSLTMALVSMAGSEEAARAQVCESLRANGVHMGACATVNGRPVDIKKALDDPELLCQIQLEDLVIASAIGKKGTYGDVTSHAKIAQTAVKSGIAKDADTISDGDLSRAKTRAHVADLLSSGQRVIGSTTGHIVYLVSVSDDGIVMHDPAGMRTTPENFLHTGTVKDNGMQWLGWMKGGKKELILRRTKGNPQLRGLFEKLAAIAETPKKEWPEALEALATEHPGRIDLGEGNFYSLSDIKALHAKAIVSMSAAPEQTTGD